MTKSENVWQKHARKRTQIKVNMRHERKMDEKGNKNMM